MNFNNLFKDEKVIIQEIHDSFDNAQDELLRQATRIINLHTPKDNNKAERLKKLGFTQSEIVVKRAKNEKLLVESKKDADLVNYYKTNYPFLKFLKEEQLDQICNKYNLIYAPVEKYTKDVPEKNVTEIENAQPLKEKDKGENKYFAMVTKAYQSAPKILKKILHKGFYIDSKENKMFINDRDMLYFAKEYGGYKGRYSGYTVALDGIGQVIEESKQGLFIAAPKSHFNLKGLKNKGLGFFNFSITEVKDPIVFRYVNGGIQVLSKWGLEAEDELLQNEILN